MRFVGPYFLDTNHLSPDTRWRATSPGEHANLRMRWRRRDVDSYRGLCAH